MNKWSNDGAARRWCWINVGPRPAQHLGVTWRAAASLAANRLLNDFKVVAESDRAELTSVSLLSDQQRLTRPRMDEGVLARMRDRVLQLGKVMSLSHAPRIIKLIQGVIEQVEADIATLEEERRKGGTPSI